MNSALPFLSRTWLAWAGLVLTTAALHGAAPVPIFPHPAHLTTNASVAPRLTWSLDSLSLINNGTFEAGTTTGWIALVDGQFGDVELSDGTNNIPFEGTAEPFDGSFSLVMYNFNGVSILSQDVTVPAGSGPIFLRWFDRIRNYGNGGEFNQNHGYGAVVQNPANGQTIGVLYVTEAGDIPLAEWTKRAADLSPYRNQTIRLTFFNLSSQGFMVTYLDNIELEVDATSAVTSDVYFGTTLPLTPANLVGTVTNGTWSLPELNPNTTHYWRIITRLGASAFTGPVWQFTTAPVGAPESLAWDNPLPPLSAGGPQSVRVTARDRNGFAATGFTGTAQLRAARVEPQAASQTLLPNVPFTAYSTFARLTLGYDFTPDTNLWVTAFRVYNGQQVTLWTDQGRLLAQQNFQLPTPGWTNLPLAQPLLLQGGRTYRLAVYTGAAQDQFARFDGSPTFAHGTLDQSYETDGNGFPNLLNPARWWYVDLVYQVAQFQPLPLLPGTTGNFADATWNGTVTLPQSPGPNVVLIAESASGLLGISPPLVLILDEDQDGMADDWEIANGFNPDEPADADQDRDNDRVNNRGEYLAGTDPDDANSRFLLLGVEVGAGGVTLRLATSPGRQHRVERTTDLDSGNWVVVADRVLGNGGELEILDATGGTLPTAFYRVVLLP